MTRFLPRIRTTALATTLVAALTAAGFSGAAAAPVVPAAVDTVTGTRFTAPSGTTSTYSVYGTGVDPQRATGVLYYFGGDYWARGESEVSRSDSATVRELAGLARSKNMLLVIPTSPDTDARGDGITWWEDADRNGDWFRALAAQLQRTYRLDPGRTWLTGYSGGAEFLSYELLTDRQSWLAPAGHHNGATLIGGGGADGGRVRFATAPSASVKQLSLGWHAGSRDTAGDTNPPQFSALDAARTGSSAYRAAGFTRTSMQTIPGADHYHYDYAQLTGADMARAGLIGPAAGYPLTGGIKAAYAARGGQAVFGTASTPELAAGARGAVYQDFSRGGWRFYWSQATGAVPIQMSGAIGRAYAAAGYSRAWGVPKAAAGTDGAGRAYQDFRTAEGVVRRATVDAGGVVRVRVR